jgi:predicted nucleic-acid-binding protein
MIVVDTNVIVRFLVDHDDAGQRRAAVATMAGGDVRLRTGVLLETEWVLRSRYGFKPADVIRAFRALMGLEGISVENADEVRRALDWHEVGLDFADALHLAGARPDDVFVTFDQGLIRRARRLSGTPEVRAPGW